MTKNLFLIVLFFEDGIIPSWELEKWHYFKSLLVLQDNARTLSIYKELVACFLLGIQYTFLGALYVAGIVWNTQNIQHRVLALQELESEMRGGEGLERERKRERMKELTPNIFHQSQAINYYL